MSFTLVFKADTNYLSLRIRVSDHFRITKREVIEQLIVILDSDVTGIRKLEPSEWDEYFNEKTLRSNE